MQPHLPAGLLDSNVEFFICGELKAHKLKDGSMVKFDDFDEAVYQLFENMLDRNPDKHKCLDEMGHVTRRDRIHQTIVCHYGGFDTSPDIKDGRLQEPEYWACPKRGTCPWEGRFCSQLKTDTGEHLTRRETEILKLIAQGNQDKEIAHLLNLSITTVTTHNKHIRQKTGLARKADLTRFAVQKQLI